MAMISLKHRLQKTKDNIKIWYVYPRLIPTFTLRSLYTPFIVISPPKPWSSGFLSFILHSLLNFSLTSAHQTTFVGSFLEGLSSLTSSLLPSICLYFQAAMR